MMSWQTATHSSQMKTVGPAISFLTSFWLLLQKEHRSTSLLLFFKPLSSTEPRPDLQICDHLSAANSVNWGAIDVVK
jgi:hypothetical protein